MSAAIAAPAHRRHDISDRVWEILEPLLPGGKGKTAGPPRITAVSSTPCAGFCALGPLGGICPPDYGDWKNTHRRFCRWRDRGVWAMLLEAVIEEPDFEWLMIDASYIKAHPHSAGARGGNQAIARTKGAEPQLHLAVDTHGMPVRLLVTEGTVADCTQALPLIEGY